MSAKIPLIPGTDLFCGIAISKHFDGRVEDLAI